MIGHGLCVYGGKAKAYTTTQPIDDVTSMAGPRRRPREAEAGLTGGDPLLPPI